MKNLCKTLIMVFVGSIIVFANTLAKPDTITRTFEKKRLIRLNTVSGDCIIRQGDNDKIEVEVTSNYFPEGSFEAEFKDRGSTLRLNERMYGSNSGSSQWAITVPAGTEIKFSSASGGMDIEKYDGEIEANTASGDYLIVDCRGVFDLNTASGDYHIENCRGEFNVNSASGSVSAEGIIILEESNFSSASGNVKLRMGSSPEYDLSVGSASGRATLDLNGNPMKGRFVMSSRERVGDIDAPIEFDDTRYFHKGIQKYIEKSIVLASDYPVISIGTASGKAILKK